MEYEVHLKYECIYVHKCLQLVGAHTCTYTYKCMPADAPGRWMLVQVQLHRTFAQFHFLQLLAWLHEMALMSARLYSLLRRQRQSNFMLECQAYGLGVHIHTKKYAYAYGSVYLCHMCVCMSVHMCCCQKCFNISLPLNGQETVNLRILVCMQTIYAASDNGVISLK